MPLDPARLSAALRQKLLDDPKSAAQPNDSLKATCDAIAAAVVAEILANALVLPTLLVAPPTGGPVTGTGKVS